MSAAEAATPSFSSADVTPADPHRGLGSLSPPPVRARIVFDGDEARVRLVPIVLPPDMLRPQFTDAPTPPPPRAATESLEAELRVSIELGGNGQWSVTIFEPDLEAESPSPPPAPSPAASSAPQPPAPPPPPTPPPAAISAEVSAEAAPQILQTFVRCKIDSPEAGGSAQVRFLFWEKLSAEPWLRPAEPTPAEAAPKAAEAAPKAAEAAPKAVEAAPKAAAASAEDNGGKWVPPKLQVKLVELAGEDQVAVRIHPRQNGDGKLDCEASPTPVYDVVITQG